MNFGKIKRFFLDIGRKTIFPVVQKRIVKKIKRKKSEDTLVILSTTAMGDLLYCMAFVKAVKQKNPLQKIAVVTREKFKYILDTYDSYDKAVFIRQNQRLALLQLRCLRSNLGYCKQMLQDGIIFEVWGMMAYAPQFAEENIDYIMAMRKAYGLSENVSPEFHRVMPAEVTSIPNFSEICGRCVVLNPYSSTLEVEKGGGYFFEQICLLLKEKGYFVYTNVIKNQKPVPGSLPLRCSLEEMLGIASKIPFMVSLRSGICDFLVPSGLNMFVIYNKLWFYIWFRLKSWEGKGTLEELYYEESAGEEESQRLVEAFKGYLAKIEREKGIFFDGHGG